MKISTIVLSVTTALLMTTFAPVSSAQENPVPAGIEVITVTAKKIEPSVASACVNAARSQTHATAAQRDAAAVSPAELINSKLQFRRAVHDCIMQSTAEAHS